MHIIWFADPTKTKSYFNFLARPRHRKRNELPSPKWLASAAHQSNPASRLVGSALNGLCSQPIDGAVLRLTVYMGHRPCQ